MMYSIEDVDKFNTEKLLFIYLDDERPGISEEQQSDSLMYVLVDNPKNIIDLLISDYDRIDTISLDHDLGDDENIGTGYDVLLWLEEHIFTNERIRTVPNLLVHSANSSARIKMELAIKTINNKINERITAPLTYVSPIHVYCKVNKPVRSY